VQSKKSGNQSNFFESTGGKNNIKIKINSSSKKSKKSWNSKYSLSIETEESHDSQKYVDTHHQGVLKSGVWYQNISLIRTKERQKSGKNKITK
jgi:hypothetical protein